MLDREWRFTIRNIKNVRDTVILIHCATVAYLTALHFVVAPRTDGFLQPSSTLVALLATVSLCLIFIKNLRILIDRKEELLEVNKEGMKDL